MKAEIGGGGRRTRRRIKLEGNTDGKAYITKGGVYVDEGAKYTSSSNMAIPSEEDEA